MVYWYNQCILLLFSDDILTGEYILLRLSKDILVDQYILLRLSNGIMFGQCYRRGKRIGRLIIIRIAALTR